MRSLRHAFCDAPHVVAYAIEANGAGTVVRAFAAEGAGTRLSAPVESEKSPAVEARSSWAVGPMGVNDAMLSRICGRAPVRRRAHVFTLRACKPKR